MLALRRPLPGLVSRQLRVRLNSTAQQPPPNRLWKGTKTTAKYAGYLCLSSVIGVATLTAGILIHDAFTYNEKHTDRVPVSPLALSPLKGGPKNLPIVGVQFGDEEEEEMQHLMTRPKLVILGGGWGVSGRHRHEWQRGTHMFASSLWVS